MASVQILDSVTHKNFRVVDTYAPELGYAQGAIVVMPSEIKDVQREYPILLRKHPETGKLFPNALLGFKEDENLFLDKDGTWTARYIPLAIRKGPFMIGFQDHSGQLGSEPLVHIDLDDPRVSKDTGEALYTDGGQLSPYMHKTSHVLLALHEGYAALDKMIDAFEKAKLIEPLNIEISFDNGEEVNFGGAYTIATEKLASLPAAALSSLNERGFLANAFYIADSVANIRRLIDLKTPSV